MSDNLHFFYSNYFIFYLYLYLVAKIFSISFFITVKITTEEEETAGDLSCDNVLFHFIKLRHLKHINFLWHIFKFSSK